MNIIYKQHCLLRYPCEIRVRSVPLTPCRRKKRKDEESVSPRAAPTPVRKQNQQPDQYNDKQVQSSQVCYDLKHILMRRWFLNY